MLVFLSIFVIELFLAVILLCMKNEGKIIITANIICVALIISFGIYCRNSSSDYSQEKKELRKIEKEMKMIKERQMKVTATLSTNMSTGTDLDRFAELNQEYNQLDEELHRLIREYNKKVERCNELLNKDREEPMFLRSCIFQKEIQPMEEHNHGHVEETGHEGHNH